MTSLPQASVTPINNIVDTEPPERLTQIELYDRPNDDGTGLLLNFELSDASDVAVMRYMQYQPRLPPPGSGPITPIATLERNLSYHC